nr:lipopolysaccharide heptosyltransferase family protein [Aeromonas salmonicida]
MSTLRDALRRFDGQRRCWTAGLERSLLAWLARRGKLPASNQPPQRILIIRSTNRIGNNLFLLPFLQQVRRAHPFAEIELVCSGGQLLPFLGDKQLQRIHQIRLQGKHLIPALPRLWHLRRQHYDSVYVPFASSTDHLIAAWVRASEKVGFDDARGDVLFDRLIAPDTHCHYAHQPLQLLGMQASQADQIELGSQLHAACPHLTALAQAHPGRPLIGFFTGARKGKWLSLPQWQRLLGDLRRHSPDALLIQLTDPASPLPPLGDMQVSLHTLSELTRFTGGLTLFVSCDTGPFIWPPPPVCLASGSLPRQIPRATAASGPGTSTKWSTIAMPLPSMPTGLPRRWRASKHLGSGKPLSLTCSTSQHPGLSCWTAPGCPLALKRAAKASRFNARTRRT